MAASGDFPAQKLNLLMNSILTAAISNITAMLRVDPVTGPLTASRVCNAGYYTSGVNAGVCAGYDTALPVCNSSPSVNIPLSYLRDAYTDCTNSSVRRGLFASFAVIVVVLVCLLSSLALLFACIA